MSLKVLGVDPGTAITGYGVVEPLVGRPGHLIECGIIRTDPKHELWNRLETLYDGLAELIARHKPDVLAVESVFYAKNVRTTIVLGHARGAILLAAAKAGLHVAEFAPATVKKTIVGAGGAAKHQVGFDPRSYRCRPLPGGWTGRKTGKEVEKETEDKKSCKQSAIAAGAPRRF